MDPLEAASNLLEAAVAIKMELEEDEAAEQMFIKQERLVDLP